MVSVSVEKSEKKAIPSRVWLVLGDWYDSIDFPNEDWYSITDYTVGDLRKSEGHQVSKLGSADDIGGDFRVIKRDYEHSSTLGEGPRHFSTTENPMEHGSQHWYFQMHAAVEHVAWWSDAFEEVEGSSDFVLDGLGTTAISRIIPTNPVWGAAAFLGELREGLPKFGIDSWKHRTGRARAAGSDYLNATFGWTPLVSDIRAFADTVRRAHELTDKYVNDSGKLLKRRYDFPDEVETHFTTDYGRNAAPGWDSAYLRSDHIGRLRHDRRVKTRRWVEAAFTYYLPPVGTKARDLAIANHLYGITPTPDVVWQLTPWSWAADWVTNIGEISSNVSAFMTDGLVMPYAYIMEEKTIRNEYILDQVSVKGYSGMQRLSQVFTTTAKTRRRATPFGFGFDFGGLTPRQTAILVALGISRRK